MKAIDVHVHIPEEPGVEMPPFVAKMGEYFGAGDRHEAGPDADKVAEMYRELDMVAVVFSVNNETAWGTPGSSNDYVAALAEKYPDRFIGFATVDPWQGVKAVRELERAVTKLGLRGLKLAPNCQLFFPDDTRFYPLYEKCVELQIPVIIHAGTTGIGAGLPGGLGVKLKYLRPIPHIDDIAADFPDLTIVMAHPAWPWQEEQLAVLRHKGNVYMDISGWSPKYYSPSLVQQMNTILQDKIMFGSDYPSLMPDRMMTDFDRLTIREEVRPKILVENARRILKLG